jgi:hypothetical protein
MSVEPKKSQVYIQRVSQGTVKFCAGSKIRVTPTSGYQNTTGIQSSNSNLKPSNTQEPGNQYTYGYDCLLFIYHPFPVKFTLRDKSHS